MCLLVIYSDFSYLNFQRYIKWSVQHFIKSLVKPEFYKMTASKNWEDKGPIQESPSSEVIIHSPTQILKYPGNPLLYHGRTDPGFYIPINRQFSNC